MLASAGCAEAEARIGHHVERGLHAPELVVGERRALELIGELRQRLLHPCQVSGPQRARQHAGRRQIEPSALEGLGQPRDRVHLLSDPFDPLERGLAIEPALPHILDERRQVGRERIHLGIAQPARLRADPFNLLAGGGHRGRRHHHLLGGVALDDVLRTNRGADGEDGGHHPQPPHQEGETRTIDAHRRLDELPPAGADPERELLDALVLERGAIPEPPHSTALVRRFSSPLTMSIHLA